MRVTSASAKVSCLLARAASRTLYDFARSEPGMTRILGTAMTDERWTHNGWREDEFQRHHTHGCVGCRRQSLRYTQTRAGGMFIHTRSDGSALTRSSRFGIGGTAL